MRIAVAWLLMGDITGVHHTARRSISNSSGIQFLFGTPVYTAQLVAENEQLLQAITPQYKRFRQQHQQQQPKKGSKKRAVKALHRLNDIFFAWQREQEENYIEQRRECVQAAGGLEQIKAASSCMMQAIEAWWPELRDTVAYRDLVGQIEHHIESVPFIQSVCRN